jgi:TolB-like protein/DNA-binding winged helix-turn-helix (wHTH) protein/Flp pilus assembly protein TadD
LILLERPGELVSREDLRTRLWPADTFVDFDHGVNTSVNRLREVLGDSAENPRFIETVPRKGYRFIAPVDMVTIRDPLPVSPEVNRIALPEAESLPPTAAPAAKLEPELAGSDPVLGSDPFGTTVVPRKRWLITLSAAAIAVLAVAGWFVLPRLVIRPPTQMRLAVLPFENLSGDPDQEFLSDGFTEELIAELGALEPNRLGVIARTTTMRYKGTAKDVGQIRTELGVDYVLEGSVRRADDRLRITAQLIEAKTQTHLWAESYDRHATDVIGIQTDVAMAIAKSLGSTLSGRGAVAPHAPPSSFAAYEHTLRGRFFRDQATEASTRKAIEHFQRAIDVDPMYAPAYAGLGDSYRLLGAPGWEVEEPAGLLKKAKAAAERALALDPTSADAHAVMAMVHFTYEWDLAASESEVKEAIRLNASSSRAHQYYSAVLTTLRRFDDAIAEAHRAMELDPLSATAGTTLGVRLWYAGKLREAEQEFVKTLEVNPSFAVAHWGLAQCYLAKGRTDDGLDELTKAVTFSDNSAYMRAHLGYAYARTGDRVRAEAIAKELEGEGPSRYVAPYHLALIAAGLGDTPRAARWLDRAFRDRSGWMTFLPVEPEFEKVRQAPDVQRLLSRVSPQK